MKYEQRSERVKTKMDKMKCFYKIIWIVRAF